MRWSRPWLARSAGSGCWISGSSQPSILAGNRGEERTAVAGEADARGRTFSPHGPHQGVEMPGPVRHLKEGILVSIPALAKAAGSGADVSEVNPLAGNTFGTTFLDEAQGGVRARAGSTRRKMRQRCHR